MLGISTGTIITGVGMAAFAIILSAVAEKNAWFASIVVALPLLTILTVFRTALSGNIATANAFSNNTFLLFWPGLAFFIVLNIAQRFGLSFWWAFATSVVATGLATWACMAVYYQLGWVTADAKPVLPAEAKAPD
jgi:hypothetical protein